MSTPQEDRVLVRQVVKELTDSELNWLEGLDKYVRDCGPFDIDYSTTLQMIAGRITELSRLREETGL